MHISSLKVNLFLCFWLCWLFTAAHGLSLVVVYQLLIEMSSLIAEHEALGRLY